MTGPEPKQSTQPLSYKVLAFGQDEYRAYVGGKLQRPVFSTQAEALAFARAVAHGERKAEPT